MELRKLRPREEVVGMICDMCSKSCASPDEDRDNCYEHGTLEAHWGFWSDGKDLTNEECHLCESCFGKVRQFIRDQGGKVRVIEVAAFESTGPDYRKKPGVDYIRLPGMVVPCMLRREILKDLDEIKKTEEANEKREQEMLEEEKRFEQEMLEEEKKSDA